MTVHCNDTLQYLPSSSQPEIGLISCKNYAFPFFSIWKEVHVPQKITWNVSRLKRRTALYTSILLKISQNQWTPEPEIAPSLKLAPSRTSPRQRGQTLKHHNKTKCHVNQVTINLSWIRRQEMKGWFRGKLMAYPCISLSHLSTHDTWYSWWHGRIRILSPSSYSARQM